jgi:hypothetical protein
VIFREYMRGVVASDYFCAVSLASITRESVLAAITEFDRIGRDAFLVRHGFGPARSYMLEHDGKRYDSKAIVGAAHGLATGQPLAAADFSGGAATVQPTLEALGFRVVSAGEAAGENVGHRKSGVVAGLAREHIDAALVEWRRLGRDDFLARYGGSSAERYVVITPADEVDALALVLGARTLAGLDSSGPWRGDRANVAQPLAALGYRVDAVGRSRVPEIAAVDAAVRVAAGRRVSGGGQGFSVDQYSKAAVEKYAMVSARRHYEHFGTVVETASRKSWDYEVEIDGTTWHVEVKGTTGDPVDVVLTPNEVTHAQSYAFVALYVVSNVNVVVGDGAERNVSGGAVRVLHPWRIEEDALRPIGFKYRLPSTSSDPTN